MSIGKKLLALGLGAGALAAGTYLYKLYKIGEDLVVDQALSFRITEKFLGIPSKGELVVNVSLKNPQNKSLSLSQPFVQLFFSTDDVEAFASSQQVNKIHDLLPLSTLNLDPIIIPVSIASLVTAAPQIYKNIIDKKPIGLYSKVTSWIDGKIRVQQTDFKEIKF